MDKAARLRWTVILLALAATIAAIVVPAGEMDDVVAPQATPRDTVRARAPAAVSLAAAGVNMMPQPFASEAETDPFEPRDWTPPPEPPPVQATPVAPAAPPVPEPPQAPPLPYKFVGRFSDDGGGYVYLANGETAHAVRAGDVIAGTHKVISIQARQIIFEHLPTGIKQEFSLPDPDQ